jgi:hypothetical protein
MHFDRLDERTMMPLRTILPLVVVSLLATPAFASDPIGPSKSPADDAPPAQVTAGATATVTAPKIEVVRMPADFEAPSRGVALPILYGSYAVLQGYDAANTLRGVGVGGVEVNPMMAGPSRNAAAMWAIKGAVTAASIVASERLWRSHRRAQAIAVMAIANGVMAGVALHNASVLNGVR